MTQRKLPSFALLPVFTIMTLTQACGGGGANTVDTGGGETTYSFRADYINLLSEAATSNAESMVDVDYKQGSKEPYEIVENLRYLQQVMTYSFGWTGLPQANVTFTTKDALNNQTTLTTSNMTLNGSLGDFFLLLTGDASNPSSIKLRRVEKQTGDTARFRFIHANPFYDGNVDIYNVATQQSLVLNLARYQTSQVIDYDANQAQTSVIVVPAGTTPNYSNTSGYLLQHSYDNQTQQTLHVLTSDATSNWQNKSYSD